MGSPLGYINTRAQGDPASELIQRVNQLRASYGQTPYQVDPILMSVAQAQASWSAANNNTSHLGPAGTGPDERAKAAGYGGGEDSFAVENVDVGTISIHTPELVVNMWQGDYGHLTAMISPKYQHIGVGYAEGDVMSWYVMTVGWTGSEGKSVTGVEGYQSPDIVSGNVQPLYQIITATPDESGAVYHQVQSGQTAWKIAEDYGINLYELLNQNNLDYESIIKPGDLLLIHPPATQTTTPLPGEIETVISPSLTAVLSTSPQISETKTPTSTTEPWTSIELAAPFPRTSLLGVFVILGIGLLLLVGITVLSNYHKI
jgi:uncharacterized protein YkwD